MPSIKIYPPSQLPDRNVSETQFNIWTEELEVYLSQEKDFAIFLPGGTYEGWGSFETNNFRIPNLNPADRVIAGGIINAEEAEAQNREKLTKIQRDLRTVLSIALWGNVSPQVITTLSSVTQQVFIGSKILCYRCDYDIQCKKAFISSKF